MNNLHIHFKIGDIAQEREEAVVNAANIYLHAGSGVCGALFSAAGPMLAPACGEIIQQLGRNLHTSEAVITPGFNLHAKWIIHAVAPMCMNNWSPSIQHDMAQTYRSIFSLADEYGIRTIAIPAMGLGVYQCDPEKSTRILVNSVAEYSRHSSGTLTSLTFVLRHEWLLELYKKLFGHEH